MPLTPGSLVACRSTASASARFILSLAAASSCGPRRRVTFLFQQAFNSSPTCFAVSFLSPLTSAQVPAPRATFAEALSFEVCPPKVSPRHFAFHQHFLQESEAPPLQASPFQLECRRQCHCHLETTGQLAFRVFGPRPISPTQAILLTFAARVLIASPCSVTTTSSDDEFSMPTNTPGWNRWFPLSSSSLAWPACTKSSLRIPGSVTRCLFDPLQPVQRCVSVAADVTPVHQGMQQIPPASTISLRRAGFWSQCDAPAQPAVFWPDRRRTPLHVR